MKSNTVVKHKQIPGFDILKFIMAIGIVGVHSHFCQAVYLENEFLGVIISKYQSLCVPGFFIVSSYLFFRKCWESGFRYSNSSYIRFVKRLLTIYLFYFILLSPVIIPNRGWFSMEFVDGLLTFFVDILLRYTFPGSWFLSALIVSVTIIWCLGRVLKTYWLLVPLFVLFVYVYNIELFSDDIKGFYIWYEQHVRIMRLSFPAALFPVCLGSFFAYPPIKQAIDEVKPHNFIVLMFIILLFIAYCAYNIVGMNVILLILVFVFFKNLSLRDGNIYIKLREYSILFFMWHFIVLEIIKVVFKKQEQDFDIYGIWLFMIVLLVIFAISTMILYLENKKFFNLLKYSH